MFFHSLLPNVGVAINPRVLAVLALCSLDSANEPQHPMRNREISYTYVPKLGLRSHVHTDPTQTELQQRHFHCISVTNQFADLSMYNYLHDHIYRCVHDRVGVSKGTRGFVFPKRLSRSPVRLSLNKPFLLLRL